VSLRMRLGADVDRVHEQVDALLDSENALILLVDRSRVVSYADGLGISPCQLELLMVEIERTVRKVDGCQHRSGR
jgi:hypothetical protein